MQFAKCAIAILLAAPIFGSGGNQPAAVTVHEWGTFTTVASADGGEAPWNPLGEASDLPCFVQHLHGLQYKTMAPFVSDPGLRTVTVRMETPVLYFYASEKAKVSVAVDFPRGLITEWYPRASVVKPEVDRTMPLVENGHIEWNDVQITPGENSTLVKGVHSSPYYAARNTDSDIVTAGVDREKLLFYRGIANFDVPIRARMGSDNILEVTTSTDEAIARPILFENRGGHIGYRLLKSWKGTREIALPELTGGLDELKESLAAGLVQRGLYRKEADAMVATWSDSWFEEGTRLIYIVPRQLVDRELPLGIKPAPKAIERVFVGRVEILSPSRRDELATALKTGDTAILNRFGRFLMPFRPQVDVVDAPSVASYVAAKESAARREFYAPSCVK